MEKYINRLSYSTAKVNHLIAMEIDPSENRDTDQILEYIDINDETGYYEYDLEEIKTLMIYDFKEMMFYLSIPFEILILPLYTVLGIFFAIYEGILFQYYPEKYEELNSDEN